ncbi:hypothetical protein BT69DRAFT_1363618 [Atractiella rhizophila]|nr:hypothetical protein BT69DRAFT_1363618 [Atractiella rhizophila]
MFNPESIHNHIQLVKQLGMCFSSIESDLQGWDAAWKAFYLVTPFSACVQTHTILTIFDLCLQSWRQVRSNGEGLAADFTSWESRSDWDSDSQQIWTECVLYQLHALLNAAESQLCFAARLYSLQIELLRNCHNHLRSVNAASYLWFWRRPAQLAKQREFDYFSDNLNQQFLTIKSCSEGLVGFWKEVEVDIQNLRSGRLQLQRSLILILISAWLDCSEVYSEVIPDPFLYGQCLNLAADFLQPSPKFRYQSSWCCIFFPLNQEHSKCEAMQADDPPVPPGPLPSHTYTMTLPHILFRRNGDLKFLVRSFKWVNASVESRWLVSPQEVRLLQEDLRFVLRLMLHDSEAFVKDFLAVFEKLLLEKNLADEKARDVVSKLHHSVSRSTTILHSAAGLISPASEVLVHSITCQLERIQSRTRRLAAVVTWIKLKWYQFWSLQPTAYSAYFIDRVLPLSFNTTVLPQDESAKERMAKWATDLHQSQERLLLLTSALDMNLNKTVQAMVQSADPGSPHIRGIFQENVEALRVTVEELIAFRKDFEEDADFLKGDYNPFPQINWSRMRPKALRARRW